MKLNLGNFVIDLNSPATLVVFLVILFGAMILASYAGQPVKKFIRTHSGRLTTKRPTPKIKAKKSVKSSSLVPMSLKKKLLKKNTKSSKVTKTSKITNTSKLGKMKTTSKIVKKAKKQRSKSSSSVGGYSQSSSSTFRSASDLDDVRKPCSRESYDDLY
jgi:hypothetical protein